MAADSYHTWGLRLGTLALWAAAAASLVFWGLRLSVPPPGAPAPAVQSARAAPDAQALARLLGATAAGPDAPATGGANAQRLALLGVLAGRHSGGGAALIAVDDKPARPFRVGSTVDQGLLLQSLGPRSARLGASLHGPATLTLDMPKK